MARILLIDDESLVVETLSDAITSKDHTVVTAANGVEGMRRFVEGKFDLVITDIIMPKLNGVDAINRIVREFPSVRIVAISGGGNFDPSGYQPASITTTAYLAAAEKAGAHYILTKPFESAELIDAVKRVIDAGHD